MVHIRLASYWVENEILINESSGVIIYGRCKKRKKKKEPLPTLT